MKLYLIKRKGYKIRPENLELYVFNNIYDRPDIHCSLAFFRKKDAERYLEEVYSEMGRQTREIISVELKQGR